MPSSTLRSSAAARSAMSGTTIWAAEPAGQARRAESLRRRSRLAASVTSSHRRIVKPASVTMARSLVGRGQRRSAVVVGPRHGEMERLASPLSTSKNASRPPDTSALRISAYIRGLSGERRRCVLRPDDGELGRPRTASRQPSPARISIRSSRPLRRLSSAAASQNSGVVVDADELAAELRRQGAHRSAGAAADVEHDVVGGDLGRGRQPQRGRNSEQCGRDRPTPARRPRGCRRRARPPPRRENARRASSYRSVGTPCPPSSPSSSGTVTEPALACRSVNRPSGQGDER